MILHTINKGPSNSALLSCLRLAADDSGILLIEEGVYAAADNAPNKALFNDAIKAKYKLYVLEADLKARGIANKVQVDFEIISYSRFVELSLEYSKVQSWS